MHFNDRDPARRANTPPGPITQLQQAMRGLDSAALPRFGTDGHLGNETWTWLQLFAERFRIDPLPRPAPGVAVYQDLIDAILAPPEDETAPAPTVTPECSGLSCGSVSSFALYDLRNERVASRPKVRMDSPTRPHVRAPERVIGICLHQTAVRFGTSPAQLRAAKGDRALALASRALNIASHLTVFCEASDKSHGPLIVPNAPLRWHVNHGNGLNPLAQGMEIDGLYAGIMSDPRTVWAGKTPTPAMESTLEVARAGLRWLYESSMNENMRLQYLWAHRQSSATRRSDPGEWLWRNVATWARDQLGLKWEPSRTWGDGLPLPAVWGVDGGARY
jgi:hypothetical protein